MQTFSEALCRRPVLIGTPETIAAMAGQLAVTGLLPPDISCILARPEDAVADASDIVGLPIAGTTTHLASLHADNPYTAALVSLPASLRATTLKVRSLLHALGIPERFVPPLTDLLGNDPVLAGAAPVLGAGAGAVNMAELIGRTPFGIDRRAVRSVVEARRVLVTGAGGSIGSELCRIAAEFGPSLIIMMERSENALFEIDRQLARRFPDLARHALLHDVVDPEATLRELTNLKPHVVFHAAAHKHVPLMEDHPAHALANNLFGTKSIADAALAVGAQRLVMISTDKAVNPESTMGATKRLAEMYVQHLGREQAGRPGRKTQFSIVRFGNVLGSACSVLPIWSQQLAEGGPLTITDPRMTRYFMTIPEAAMLVVQSAAIEPVTATPPVFVLDMGEPIRILDLARRFARLNGFEPRIRDAAAAPADASSASDAPSIDITLTGARPGEKLHEELAYQAEALSPSAFPGILELRDSQPLPEQIPDMIRELETLRQSPDKGLVRAAIRRRLSPDSDPGNRQKTLLSKRNPNKAASNTGSRTFAA